ncbi:MAG TPA: xanthine dehydrogenase family protein molybdopterin-binding subunit [Micropepsaceae bacterium]|nr:xanthine dehydrogenase family protein molybdopterin-binding subunit [Micropepsaceae bacterium]
MKTSNTYVGTPVKRVEDVRFLTGRGIFVGDLERENVLYAAILRSPVAHGRIVSIDTARALEIAGVHRVIAAGDIGTIPRIPMRQEPMPELKLCEQPVIAEGKVRYVGEPVAVVLAETLGAAEDAVSAIDLVIDPLPPTVEMSASAQRLLFEDIANNIATTMTASLGDAETAFRIHRGYVRRGRFSVHRHTAVAMEPRGLMAEWDADTGQMTLYGAAKVPFPNKRILARQLGLKEDAVTLFENDVGGAFGARGEFYPEDFLIPFAARLSGRPVKWSEDRRENLFCTNHAREASAELEIACEADGTIVALRGHAQVDIGAYIRTVGATPARNIIQVLSGPYRIPNIQLEVTLHLTNKTPAGTYRGPGRFEADFFRERLFDLVAEDLELDRVQFRRRNLIPREAMPYRLATVARPKIEAETDSGDYRETLDRCLAEFGWEEKQKLNGKRIDGRYHGLGIGCYLEGGASGPKENARLKIESDGRVSVFVGSSAVGQGLETAFAQIAADAMELPLERVLVFHGSTHYLADGYGSYSSRAIVMGGSAIVAAASSLRDAIRARVAAKLGCKASEVTIVEDAALGPAESRIAFTGLSGLSADGTFTSSKRTYSYGAHAAHVAVDASTGHVELIDYVAVEDVGRIVNPATLHGQTLGAIVQGLGGTLMEELVYDANGQLVTASLADYLMPTASDFPRIRVLALENHPAPHNPLGAKGAGEGGIIPVGGVIANAVAAALESFAIEPNVLPLSPPKLWRLLQASK